MMPGKMVLLDMKSAVGSWVYMILELVEGTNSKALRMAGLMQTLCSHHDRTKAGVRKNTYIRQVFSRTVGSRSDCRLGNGNKDRQLQFLNGLLICKSDKLAEDCRSEEEGDKS